MPWPSRSATPMSSFLTATPVDARSFLDQRAIRLAQRAKHVVAGERILDLLQVPWVLRLARATNLDEIHVVHEPAVVPDLAIADDGIADRHLAHFCRDRGDVERLGGLDRAQIVTRGRVDTGLAHRRHGLVTLVEFLGEGPA